MENAHLDRKIALVANLAPWPFTNGATVRQYYLLRSLRDAGYSVTLFGFCESKHLSRARLELGKICDDIHIEEKRSGGALLISVVLALLKAVPISVQAYTSASLIRSIKRYLAHNPNAAVIAHSSNVAQLIPKSIRSRSTLDMTDVDSSKFREYSIKKSWPMSWVNRREAKLLEKFEYQMLEEFGRTVLGAKRELKEWNQQKIIPFHSKILIVSNGVDELVFKPNIPTSELFIPLNEKRFFDNRSRVLFTGVMDYPPNVEAVMHFIRDVWPAVKRLTPNAKFTIMGSRPSPAVLKLQQDPSIEVTGFVDSAVPYFSTASVVVIPLLHSRGISNKALEAMAIGSRIVTYGCVAEGVGENLESCLWIANSSLDFASATSKLLSDPAYGQDRGVSARAYVQEQHNWSILMGKILESHIELSHEDL